METHLVKRKKMIAARKGMHLTQEELAKIAGVSRAYIGNVERGAHMPSLPVAYKIAKALKKSIEDIFFNLTDRKTIKKAA